MDGGPSSMKKWKNKFFLIDRSAIPDFLIWRHLYSCVFDDLPLDGYDRNDVESLCDLPIQICELNKAVLVHFGLSSVWSNQKCDPVFKRKDDNSASPFPTSILERVYNNIIAPAAEGTPIPLPTPDKIAAAQPDPVLAKKSKVSVKQNTSTSLAPFGPSQPSKKKQLRKKSSEARLGKRLGSPPCLPYVTTFDPSHAGTSGTARASTSGLGLVQKDTLARSSLSRDEEYDQIHDDDFASASRGEEINLIFFPLAPGP
ncbi:hypothetical protein Tco_0493872 [Tanacetum coccineum]